MARPRVIPDLMPAELRSLEVALNRGCRFQCRACHLRGSDEGLPTEDWLRIFAGARRAGVGAVQLTGGNPLLRPDLAELVRGAADLGLKVGLSMSGEGLTARRIQALRQAGLARVDISMEGFSEDRFPDRDPDVRTHAVAAIQSAHENGLPVRAAVLVTRLNRPNLGATVRHAQQLGAGRVVIRRPTPTDDRVWFERARLHREDMLLLQHQIAHLAAEESSAVIIGCGLSFVGAGSDPSVEPSQSSCHAARDRLFIDSDGAAYPCSRLVFEETYLGLAQEKELDRLWRNHPLLACMRNRHELRGDCWSCPASWRCRGCRAVALAVEGHIMASDPDCPLAQSSDLKRSMLDWLRRAQFAWHRRHAPVQGPPRVPPPREELAARPPQPPPAPHPGPSRTSGRD